MKKPPAVIYRMNLTICSQQHQICYRNSTNAKSSLKDGHIMKAACSKQVIVCTCKFSICFWPKLLEV